MTDSLHVHPSPKEEHGAPERVRLDISGMTCAACSARVQRALESAAGVHEASVNLMTRRAAIGYDPIVTSPNRLVEVVERAGYGARLDADADAAHEHHAAGVQGARPATHDHSGGSTPWFPLAAFAIAMVISMLLDGAPGGHGDAGTDPLMALMRPATSLLQHLLPGAVLVPAATWRWILLALTLPVVLLSGRHFYVRAWSAARHGAADMNTLIALGTGAALFFSIATTVFAGWFLDHGVVPAVYYEAVAGIIALIVLGQWLEERAKGRACGGTGQAAGIAAWHRSPGARRRRRRGASWLARGGRRVPGAPGRIGCGGRRRGGWIRHC